MSYRELLFKALSAEILAKGIFAIIPVATIRFMPLNDFAVYALVLAFTSFVTSLVGSIFNIIYLVGGFEKQAAPSFFSLQLGIVCLLGLLAAPAYAVFSGSYTLMVGLIAIQVTLTFAQTQFQRELQFGRYYMLEYLRLAVFLGTAVGIVVINDFSVSVREMILAQGAAALVALVFCARQSFSKAMLRVESSVALFRVLFRSVYVKLLFYHVFLLIVLNLDIFVLRALTNDTSVAIFGAAFRYYSVLALGLQSVHRVLLPMLRLVETAAEIRLILRQHLKISAAGLPLLLLAVFVAEHVIPILDNGRYPGSIPVFQVLACSAYLSFLLSPFVNVLIQQQRFGFLMKVAASVALFHFVSSAGLVYWFEAVGAAVADLVAYGILNGVVFLASRKILRDLDGKLKIVSGV